MCRHLGSETPECVFSCHLAFPLALSSCVTVVGDRAVLSGIMQIVTSAVRVLCHVMFLSSRRGLKHRTSIPCRHRVAIQMGDLPVDPVASGRDPSVFRACQVVLLCGGHAHCHAIHLVRIARCLSGMISVHVQFLCRCLLQCRQGPRLSVSRWTPSHPLRARLPPLGCRWNCRRYSTCCFHPQVCLDPRSYEKEVGSVRADVRSCRHGLDEAQLAVALRETTHLCVQCLHAYGLGRRQHRIRKGWPCQDLLPTVWARGGRRLISEDFQLAKFHSGVGASRRRTLRGASGQTH